MLTNFHYYHQDNTADQTLILLHGTGGDEHDLLPLVEPYQKDYNILSLRGNISEQGMLRFFARSSQGVFDQQSIVDEVEKLRDFLKLWYLKNKIAAASVTFLGYSNGANMILATLLKNPILFTRVVLLHPMLPFDPIKTDLNHIKAMVTMGSNDTMIPVTESLKVVDKLESYRAVVDVVEHSGGHEIRPDELAAIATFLK